MRCFFEKDESSSSEDLSSEVSSQRKSHAFCSSSPSPEKKNTISSSLGTTGSASSLNGNEETRKMQFLVHYLSAKGSKQKLSSTSGSWNS